MGGLAAPDQEALRAVLASVARVVKLDAGVGRRKVVTLGRDHGQTA